MGERSGLGLAQRLSREAQRATAALTERFAELERTAQRQTVLEERLTALARELPSAPYSQGRAPSRLFAQIDSLSSI